MTARRPRLLGPNGPTRAGLLALLGVVGAVAGAAYLTTAQSGSPETLRGAAPTARAAAPLRVQAPTPSASEFGVLLVANANEYAASHGDPKRLSRPRCVSPDAGYYMCVYVVRRAGRTECHLVQARWTPERESTYTITLGGRVPKCGSVREAIRSL